jgi:hypothetical protein
MKWIVIGLLALASALFGVGLWTRLAARSADERGGADIPFMLAALLLAIDAILVVGWAVGRFILAS